MFFKNNLKVHKQVNDKNAMLAHFVLGYIPFFVDNTNFSSKMLSIGADVCRTAGNNLLGFKTIGETEVSEPRTDLAEP